MEILKRSLYQWLKALINIRGNVKKEKIFKTLGIDIERDKNKIKRKLNITVLHSIKAKKNENRMPI